MVDVKHYETPAPRAFNQFDQVKAALVAVGNGDASREQMETLSATVFRLTALCMLKDHSATAYDLFASHQYLDVTESSGQYRTWLASFNEVNGLAHASDHRLIEMAGGVVLALRRLAIEHAKLTHCPECEQVAEGWGDIHDDGEYLWEEGVVDFHKLGQADLEVRLNVAAETLLAVHAINGEAAARVRDFASKLIWMKVSGSDIKSDDLFLI